MTSSFTLGQVPSARTLNSMRDADRDIWKTEKVKLRENSLISIDLEEPIVSQIQSYILTQNGAAIG